MLWVDGVLRVLQLPEHGGGLLELGPQVRPALGAQDPNSRPSAPAAPASDPARLSAAQLLSWRQRLPCALLSCPRPAARRSCGLWQCRATRRSLRATWRTTTSGARCAACLGAWRWPAPPAQPHRHTARPADELDDRLAAGLLAEVGPAVWGGPGHLPSPPLRVPQRRMRAVRQPPSPLPLIFP